MEFVYNDGGRAKAGFKGNVGDCVCRSIAIATGKPYKEVYYELNKLARKEKKSKRRKGTSSARNGVHRVTYQKYLEYLGWKWQPTMFIGSGCKVHLRKDELPPGRLIVSLSKHMTAVIDGVIHDTYLDDRNGTRCVYGYFYKDC